MNSSGAMIVLQILVSVFLAILFLQSGVDKIVDRRGNTEWLTSHFSKSVFAGMVSLLLSVLTVLEIAAGALSAAGAVMLAVRHDSTAAYYGAVTSGITIVCLFLGQRLAKDYAGASTLVPYFLLSLLGIYLLGQ